MSAVLAAHTVLPWVERPGVRTYLLEPPASLISVTSNSHRLVKEGVTIPGLAGKSSDSWS